MHAQLLSHHAARHILSREWVMQRIGWACMAALCAAALLGVFGHGPLSAVEASSGPALRVEYARFGRWDAPMRMTIRCQSSQPELSLLFDRNYWSDLEIDQITPPPQSSSLSSDSRSVLVRFETGTAPIVVDIDARPRRSGRLTCDLRIDGAPDGAAVRIEQFVYP